MSNTETYTTTTVRSQNQLLNDFCDIVKIVRKSLGLSGEKFASLIGVTRQTINNFERKSYKLPLSMYLLIRYTLDDIISNKKTDTSLLKAVLQVFIDDPDNYTDDMRNDLKDLVEMFDVSEEKSHAMYVLIIGPRRRKWIPQASRSYEVGKWHEVYNQQIAEKI